VGADPGPGAFLEAPSTTVPLAPGHEPSDVASHRRTSWLSNHRSVADLRPARRRLQRRRSSYQPAHPCKRSSRPSPTEPDWWPQLAASLLLVLPHRQHARDEPWRIEAFPNGDLIHTRRQIRNRSRHPLRHPVITVTKARWSTAPRDPMALRGSVTCPGRTQRLLPKGRTNRRIHREQLGRFGPSGAAAPAHGAPSRSILVTCGC
jgi:hypothetical protein